MRGKCESEIVINVSALIPFENVEGLGNDSAELDILRLTGQHCVRGPDICPWIGTSEPGNREVMRSAKLTEKMKSIINRNTSVSTNMAKDDHKR